MRTPRFTRASHIAALFALSLIICVLSVMAEGKPASRITSPAESVGVKTAFSPASIVVQSAPASAAVHFVEVYSNSISAYLCENITVADFDQDGRPDIVIAETVWPSPKNSALVLWRNLGNWTFTPATVATYPEDASYGYTVAAADLNNDDWPDLVYREGYQTHVLLNDQTGDFTPVWTNNYGAYGGLTMGDMNGDGYVDILAGQCTYSGGRIDLFTNDGAGTDFSRTWYSPPVGEGYNVVSDIAVAQLNTDTAPDIIATEYSSGLLTTFVGDGTGNAFTQVTFTSPGAHVYGAVGGNFDDDQFTDIALYSGSALHVYTAQGDGTLAETWTGPGGCGGSVLTSEDFNQDGYDDLFSANICSGRMYIFLSRPAAGGFSLAWSDTLPTGIYDVSVTDMDGDAYPDLVMMDSASVLHIWRFTLTLHLPMIFGRPG